MQSLKCQIGEGETFCGLLLALLLVQPHILWLSSLLIACIQISHILFCKSALSQLPACTVTWGCSALAWDWAFLFVELQDFPTDPYLQLIHIPLMNCNSASQTGRVNFTVYQLESIHHPSPCLFIKIPNIMGCFQSFSMPGEMTLASTCQMASTWLITNFQAQMFSQFSSCLIFCIFFGKGTVRGLQTLVHRASCFILQAIKSVKHKSSLLNPCWLFISILLPILCLKMDSERICSKIFLETEVRLTDLYFPRVFLFFLMMIWH